MLELLRPLTGQESWDHFDWRDLGTTGRILSHAVGDLLRPVLSRISERLERRRLIQQHRSVLRRLSGSGVRKITFVCLGNVCRSPFAALLLAQTDTGEDYVRGVP